MLSWFPSMWAIKAFWRLMGTVLTWLCACHLGDKCIGTSQWCDAFLEVLCPHVEEYQHPALFTPSLRPEDTRAIPIWITVRMHPANTWWPQNQAKSHSLQSYDILYTPPALPPLSSSAKYVVLGPNESEIYLRQHPKMVFCFEDLWRTSKEWCYALIAGESAWMGGLTASQAEDGAHSSGTFLPTPSVFSWQWI